MKEITATCDNCKESVTYKVGSGQQYPEVLHWIGWMEVCDKCREKAHNLLQAAMCETKE